MIQARTRILSLLTALVILTCSLVSCGTSSDTAPMGFKEISDPEVTYHLYVPDEWITDVSTGMTSAYYDGRDPSNISMTAFELDGTVTSVADYWALYEADFKAIFPDMEYVDAVECTLDDVAAMQYIYTATMSDIQYKFMQVIALRQGQVYIFTYTATAEKYDTHIEDVIAILDYFSFKK
ncbi:MAG: hypothetical protein IJ493_09400 [Clostridia bacterium]|nr:hypothetical protein [Clostridia bacterium]